MQVSIRRFAPEDAEAVASVMFRSVRQGALSDYTPEQARAWLPGPPTLQRVQALAEDGRLFLVATADDGAVVGWADMTVDGYIDHLYCAPQVIGEGVGSALYEALEQHARQRALHQLTVHASEPARRLFTARGFTTDRRQDLERHGVQLHNYVMHKDLDAHRSPWVQRGARPSDHLGVRDVHVVLIGTLREHRRRGVVSALIGHALRAAADHDDDRASARVDSAQPPGAHGIFERAGSVPGQRHVRWTLEC